MEHCQCVSLVLMPSRDDMDKRMVIRLGLGRQGLLPGVGCQTRTYPAPRSAGKQGSVERGRAMETHSHTAEKKRLWRCVCVCVCVCVVRGFKLSVFSEDENLATGPNSVSSSSSLAHVLPRTYAL